MTIKCKNKTIKEKSNKNKNIKHKNRKIMYSKYIQTLNINILYIYI